MVAAGQIRRWTMPAGYASGFNSEHFLVVREMGKFYPPGGRRGEEMVAHWELLADGELLPGWSTTLLERESVPLSDEQAAAVAV